MGYKNQNVIIILLVTVLVGCYTNEHKTENPSRCDTLTIGYSDTILKGKQIFPVITDSNKLKGLVEEKVLLSFESDNYYYVFYNKNKKIDFLSNTYWNQLTLNYLNLSDVDSLNHSLFIRLDYTDGPFLTGFYNSKDSIIVLTSDLRKKGLENIERLNVSYFSTADTLLKLNGGISVGLDLKDVIAKLQIPYTSRFLKQKQDVKIALMEASSLIDNAWYNLINPDCCLDYSTTVVLSFKENKLVEIQYLDLEYIYYVFRKKDLITKDVHYH